MTDDRKVNWEKVDEVALALLSLTLHDDCRVWKGLDWDVMNNLHQKKWILDPVDKAKSVVLTREGKEKAKEFFQKHFAIE